MNKITLQGRRLWPAMFVLCFFLLSVAGVTAWSGQVPEDVADTNDPYWGLYWTEYGSNFIHRANLDGSQVEEVIRVPGDQYRGPMPAAIIIDRAASEMIFWAKVPDSWQTYQLWKAGLDGSYLRPAFLNLHQFVRSWDDSIALGLDVQNHDLYWPSDQPYQPYNSPARGSIARGNLDTGDIGIRFMPGPEDPLGFPEEQPDLELDPSLDMFYWSDSDGIRRAALDGVEGEIVFYNNLDRTPFALDSETSMIYFVTVNSGGQGEDALARFDLGTGEKTLLAAEGSGVKIMDVAVDTVHDKLYWSVQGWEAAIKRSNLDGSDKETLIDHLEGPLGLAIDAAAGKVYWADWFTQKIQRMNLDGSALEDLVDTAPMRPRFLALNFADGLIYWTGLGNGRVWQAPKEGGDMSLLVPGDSNKTGGIAYNPLADTLYWTDTAVESVTMARGDGTDVRNVLYPRLRDARGLFVDQETRNIVWFDLGPQAIKRANLDGSETETILSGDFGEVTALAWDPLRQTFCWADPILRNIGCAGWNGGNRRIILSETDGLRRPNKVAIDPRAGHIYWTDWGTKSLHRANLDGSDRVDIVSGTLIEPSGLALHLETLEVQRAYLPLLTGAAGK